jgi:hypothetical protein
VKSSAGLLAIYLTLTITNVSCKEIEGGTYLKGDGLTAPLEVVELQGGVVGFTGKYYRIEKDGEWSAGPLLPGRGTKGAPTAKGKFTSKELTQLAKQLHKYRLSTLSSHGAPEVNPRIVKIKMGQHVNILNPNRGDTAKEEDLAIRNRYEGILNAVKGLCATPSTSP